MQNTRPIPILESASNTEDNTIFSNEDEMKYRQAAKNPDPKKLRTKEKHTY